MTLSLDSRVLRLASAGLLLSLAACGEGDAGIAPVPTLDVLASPFPTFTPQVADISGPPQRVGGVTGDTDRPNEEAEELWEPSEDAPIIDELGASFDTALLHSQSVTLAPMKVKLLDRNVPGNTIELSRNVMYDWDMGLRYGLRDVRLVDGTFPFETEGESLGALRRSPLTRTPAVDAFEGVLPGVDVSYRIEHFEAKQSFVLNELPEAVQDLVDRGANLTDQRLDFVEDIAIDKRFSLVDKATNTGVELPLDEIIESDRLLSLVKRIPLFQLHQAVARDAAGDEIALKMHLVLDAEGRGRITTRLPLEWLADEARTFPVEVDPTFSVFPCRAGQTCTIDSASITAADGPLVSCGITQTAAFPNTRQRLSIPFLGIDIDETFASDQATFLARAGIFVPFSKSCQGLGAGSTTITRTNRMYGNTNFTESTTIDCLAGGLTPPEGVTCDAAIVDSNTCMVTGDTGDLILCPNWYYCEWEVDVPATAQNEFSTSYPTTLEVGYPTFDIIGNELFGDNDENVTTGGFATHSCSAPIQVQACWDSSRADCADFRFDTSALGGAGACEPFARANPNCGGAPNPAFICGNGQDCNQCKNFACNADFICAEAGGAAGRLCYLNQDFEECGYTISAPGVGDGFTAGTCVNRPNGISECVRTSQPNGSTCDDNRNRDTNVCGGYDTVTGLNAFCASCTKPQCQSGLCEPVESNLCQGDACRPHPQFFPDACPLPNDDFGACPEGGFCGACTEDIGVCGNGICHDRDETTGFSLRPIRPGRTCPMIPLTFSWGTQQLLDGEVRPAGIGKRNCYLEEGICVMREVGGTCEQRRPRDLRVDPNFQCDVVPATRISTAQLNYNRAPVQLGDYRCFESYGQCQPGPDGRATGACNYIPKPAGTPCSWPNQNTCQPQGQCNGAGSCVAVSGFECRNAYQGAPPGYEVTHCLQAVCDPSQGCIIDENVPYIPNGTTCNPNNFCFVNGRCQNGVCEQDPRDCRSELLADGIEIDDSCSSVLCNEGPENGPGGDLCELDVEPYDGMPCSAGLADCVEQRCDTGRCQAFIRDDNCPDAGECAVAFCDPVDGCVNDPLPDGTPCTDGLCEAGVCVVTDDLCGNGELDEDEACDLGEDNGLDQRCTASCELATCGDGFLFESGDLGLDIPAEECDDGARNGAEDSLCREDCTYKRCGDGVVSPELGEECDPGTGDASCTAACKVGFRGDDFVTAGEDCDTGPNGNASCGITLVGECGIFVNGSGGFAPTAIGIGRPILEDRLCDDGNRHTEDRCIATRNDLTQCQHQRISDPAPNTGPSVDFLAAQVESFTAEAVEETLVVYEGHQIALQIVAEDFDNGLSGCDCDGVQSRSRLRLADSVRVAWPELEPEQGTLRHGASQIGEDPEHGEVAIYTAPAIPEGENRLELTIEATVSDSGAGLVDDEDTTVIFEIRVERGGEELDPVEDAGEDRAVRSVEVVNIEAPGAPARAPAIGLSWAPGVPSELGVLSTNAPKSGFVSAGQPLLVTAPPTSKVDLFTLGCDASADGCRCTQDSGQEVALRDLVEYEFDADYGRLTRDRGLSTAWIAPENMDPLPGWRDVTLSASREDRAPYLANLPGEDLEDATVRVISHFYAGRDLPSLDPLSLARMFEVELFNGSYFDETDGLLYGSGLIHLDATSLPSVLDPDGTSDLDVPDFPRGVRYSLPVVFDGIGVELQERTDLEGNLQEVFVMTEGELNATRASRFYLTETLSVSFSLLRIVPGGAWLDGAMVYETNGIFIELTAAQITGNMELYDTDANWFSSSIVTGLGSATRIEHVSENVLVDFTNENGITPLHYFEVTDDQTLDGTPFATERRDQQAVSEFGVFSTGPTGLILPDLWGSGPQVLATTPSLFLSARGLHGALALTEEQRVGVIGFDTTFNAGGHLEAHEGEWVAERYDAELVPLLGGQRQCLAFDARPEKFTGAFQVSLLTCDARRQFSSTLQVGDFLVTLTDTVLDVDPDQTVAGDVSRTADHMGVVVRETAAAMPFRWGFPRTTLVAGGLEVLPDRFAGRLRLGSDVGTYLASMNQSATIRSGSSIDLDISSERRTIEGDLILTMHLNEALTLAPGESRDLTFPARINSRGEFAAHIEDFPDIQLAPGYNLEVGKALIDFNEHLSPYPGVRGDGILLSSWFLRMPSEFGGSLLSGEGLYIDARGLQGRFEKRFGTKAQLFGFEGRLDAISFEIENYIATEFLVEAEVFVPSLRLNILIDVEISPTGEFRVTPKAQTDGAALTFDIGGLLDVTPDPGRSNLGVRNDGTGFIQFDGYANIRDLPAENGPASIRLKNFRFYTDGSSDYESLELLDDVRLDAGVVIIDRIRVSPFSAARVKGSLANIGVQRFIDRNVPGDGGARLGTDLASVDIADIIQNLDLAALFKNEPMRRIVGQSQLGRIPQRNTPTVPGFVTLRQVMEQIPVGDDGDLWSSMVGRSVGQLLGEPRLEGFTFGDIAITARIDDVLRDMRLVEVYGGVADVGFSNLLFDENFKDQLFLRRLLRSISIEDLLPAVPLNSEAATANLWQLVANAGYEATNDAPAGQIIEDLGYAWPTSEDSRIPAFWTIDNIINGVRAGDLFFERGIPDCYLQSLTLDSVRVASGETLLEYLNRFDAADLIGGLTLSDLGLLELSAFIDPSLDIGATIAEAIENPRLGDLIAESYPTLELLLGLDEGEFVAGNCVPSIGPGECLGELPLNLLLDNAAAVTTVDSLARANGLDEASDGPFGAWLKQDPATGQPRAQGLSEVSNDRNIANCLTGDPDGLNLSRAMGNLSLAELLGTRLSDIDLSELQRQVEAKLQVDIEGTVQVGGDLVGGDVAFSVTKADPADPFAVYENVSFSTDIALEGVVDASVDVAFIELAGGDYGFSVDGEVTVDPALLDTGTMRLTGRAGRSADGQGGFDYWFGAIDLDDDWDGDPRFLKPISTTGMCLTGMGGGVARNYDPVPRRNFKSDPAGEPGPRRLPGSGIGILLRPWLRDCAVRNREGDNVKIRGQAFFEQPVFHDSGRIDGEARVTVDARFLDDPNIEGFGQVYLPYDLNRDITGYFQVGPDGEYRRINPNVEAKGRVDFRAAKLRVDYNMDGRVDGRIVGGPAGLSGSGSATFGIDVDQSQGRAVTNWSARGSGGGGDSYGLFGSSFSYSYDFSGELGGQSGLSNGSIEHCGEIDMSGNLKAKLKVNFVIKSKTFTLFNGGISLDGKTRATPSSFGVRSKACVTVRYLGKSSTVCARANSGSVCN